MKPQKSQNEIDKLPDCKSEKRKSMKIQREKEMKEMQREERR